jgi:hypothetical protein
MFIILLISMIVLCLCVNKSYIYCITHPKQSDTPKYKSVHIIWWPFILLLISIISLLSCLSLSEHFNIYNNWQKDLNDVNRLVRKNNFKYYPFDKDVKKWVMKLLQARNCKNLFISNHLYYGHPDLEFNYSHTMSNKVILSNSEYTQLMNMYKNKNPDVIYTVGSTIVHESAHIQQRQNYNSYKALYKMWGFHHIPSDIQNFDHILKYKRQNPDANDNNIVWMDKFNNTYFINCFFSKHNTNTSVTKYAYPIDHKNNTYTYNNRKPILLDNLTEYNDFFGNIYNNYTPNEIYASYTEIYFKECYDDFTLHNDGYLIFKNNFT